MKRTFDSAMSSLDGAHDGEARISPYLPMFEAFRAELDEHHDRRERIVKSSRDITAASKKIIFALQRVRTLGMPIPRSIAKSIAAFQNDTIAPLYAKIAPDVQDINAHRYLRQVSPSLQEYTEAILFEHYLATQTLLTYVEMSAKVATLLGGGSEKDQGGVHGLLTPQDYLLGVYDATGELMRFAITSMATTGSVPSSTTSSTSSSPEKQQGRTVLQDLQTLRHYLETLDISGTEFYFAKSARQKEEVMRQSVEKVEKALYGLVVRGSERPKGWLPPTDDDTGGRAPEPLESY